MMRSALGLGLGLTQGAVGGVAAAPSATERVINTTLDTSDNTSAPQGGWTIALGAATNTIQLRQLQFELTASIAAGNVSQVQVDVSANPNAVGVLVEAFATGDSSFFLMLDDASGTSGVKTATNVAVTGGPYDRVRIRCSGDAGAVISGLSVIA